jgi:hypothetical protein
MKRIIFLEIISRFSLTPLICIKEDIKFTIPRRKENE